MQNPMDFTGDRCRQFMTELMVAFFAMHADERGDHLPMDEADDRGIEPGEAFLFKNKEWEGDELMDVLTKWRLLPENEYEAIPPWMYDFVGAYRNEAVRAHHAGGRVARADRPMDMNVAEAAKMLEERLAKKKAAALQQRLNNPDVVVAAPPPEAHPVHQNEEAPPQRIYEQENVQVIQPIPPPQAVQAPRGVEEQIQRLRQANQGPVPPHGPNPMDREEIQRRLAQQLRAQDADPLDDPLDGMVDELKDEEPEDEEPGDEFGRALAQAHREVREAIEQVPDEEPDDRKPKVLHVAGNANLADELEHLKQMADEAAAEVAEAEALAEAGFENQKFPVPKDQKFPAPKKGDKFFEYHEFHKNPQNTTEVEPVREEKLNEVPCTCSQEQLVKGEFKEDCAYHSKKDE